MDTELYEDPFPMWHPQFDSVFFPVWDGPVNIFLLWWTGAIRNGDHRLNRKEVFTPVQLGVEIRERSKDERLRG